MPWSAVQRQECGDRRDTGGRQMSRELSEQAKCEIAWPELRRWPAVGGGERTGTADPRAWECVRRRARRLSLPWKLGAARSVNPDGPHGPEQRGGGQLTSLTQSLLLLSSAPWWPCWRGSCLLGGGLGGHPRARVFFPQRREKRQQSATDPSRLCRPHGCGGCLGPRPEAVGSEQVVG